ncbi:LpqN/LpqT family lipoprotein [Frankia sp. AvcI1]|nr:LpqN/LpqT family lipoprotein [Frankia sp. AvcI1]
MIRNRTGPHRAGGDRTAGQRRSGGPRTAAMERDFPEADDVNDLDEADELDDRRDGGGGDSMSFLHRLGVALVVLAVALGVGVGAGVVWEKVRPSGRTATDAPLAPSPSASAAASGPAATGPGASAAASTGGPPAAGQIAVPADWAPYTDPLQKATFSHPPVWKQRRDNTGIFYGEPGTVSDYGPQMIGVARIAGTDPTAALTRVQAGEFDAVSGLTKERSGPTTDTSGQPTQELAGSYDREGQRVSYLMRTVAADGAVYVLIARVSTSAAATLNTLMGALRASFSPVA